MAANSSVIIQRVGAHAAFSHLRDVDPIVVIDGDIVRGNQIAWLVAPYAKLCFEIEILVEDQHRAFQPVDDQVVSLAIPHDACSNIKAAWGTPGFPEPRDRPLRRHDEDSE